MPFKIRMFFGAFQKGRDIFNIRMIKPMLINFNNEMNRMLSTRIVCSVKGLERREPYLITVLDSELNRLSAKPTEIRMVSPRK